jgi:Zn-dependent peptidase ImmA (M78 family)
MMAKVKQNIERLKYLLSLYKMTTDELLFAISSRLKNPFTENDILSEEIEVNALKKIDKIFNKGLHFYLDPAPITTSKDASIFFRKTTFGTDLNIGAKKIVNQFEDLKISLSAIAKLADINLNRSFPVYSIKDDPRNTAIEVRQSIYPDFTNIKKNFLRAFIGKLAAKNVLVFEYIETRNKKEKSNIDGFFLNPNVIVLKRNQNSFSREIFTLAHELGHFLINEEEIEEIDVLDFADNRLNAIERWCNDFAYYFLAGNYANTMDQLEVANGSNDYHHDMIEQISRKTNLSRLALFTRLLLQKKISSTNYTLVKNELDEQYRQRQEQIKATREQAAEDGRKYTSRSAVPIKSPLLISTLQVAFYEGVINEYQVCKTLNITPDKLNKYIL